MKLKKFAILLFALLTLTVLMSSALAGTRIDTDAASLQTANASEAASGQSGTVDGIISFDYNGKTYTYYHMNDGGSGYFLPVVYMQEALDAAFSLETPSEAVQGYQQALESAMSAFLGGGATGTAQSANDLDNILGNSGGSSSSSSSSSSSASTASGSSSSSSSSSATTSGSAVDNSKDDPYGALSGSSSSSSKSSSSKSGSTPELGDESTPITVLALIALLAAAGMLYARRRSMEA